MTDRFEIEIDYANQAQRDQIQSLIDDEITMLAARIKASNKFNKISIKKFNYEQE